MIDTLRAVQNLHRKAIAEIDGYIANAQKAKVNKSDSSESPRSVDTNRRSSLPRPKGDQFQRTPEVMRATIERMRASKEAEQEKLQLEKQLAAEAKAWFDAKQKLISLQKR